MSDFDPVAYVANLKRMQEQHAANLRQRVGRFQGELAKFRSYFDLAPISDATGAVIGDERDGGLLLHRGNQPLAIVTASEKGLTLVWDKDTPGLKQIVEPEITASTAEDLFKKAIDLLLVG